MFSSKLFSNPSFSEWLCWFFASQQFHWKYLFPLGSNADIRFLFNGTSGRDKKDCNNSGHIDSSFSLIFSRKFTLLIVFGRSGCFINNTFADSSTIGVATARRQTQFSWPTSRQHQPWRGRHCGLSYLSTDWPALPDRIHLLFGWLFAPAAGIGRYSMKPTISCCSV